MFLSGSLMRDEDDPPEDDPELVALLDFEPVPRRIERGNGWSAENQRAFIAGLVETGNYRLAAQRLGLTASGVYQLRKDAGAEDFSRAWDEALALHRARMPKAVPRPAREARNAEARRASEVDRDEHEAIIVEILGKYWRKLEGERRARLEGRIVEADFYVRQLSYIEIVLDLGGKTQQVLDSLRCGQIPLTRSTRRRAARFWKNSAARSGRRKARPTVRRRRGSARMTIG